MKATDSVKDYLQRAYGRVEELKRKIEIDFEKAFEFNAEGNLLQNLNHLGQINTGITSLVDKMPNGTITTVSTQLEQISGLLQEIKSAQQKQSAKEKIVVRIAKKEKEVPVKKKGSWFSRLFGSGPQKSKPEEIEQKAETQI